MEENGKTDHQEGNGETDQPSYLITIKEMEDKIKETPKILNHTAGKESCCIFRAPPHLVQINEKAYHPQILSIGPYHHGKPHLNMIEELKWKYLGQLLDRTPPNGLKLDGYLKLIAPMENKIRDCYSEVIPFNGSDLIKIMVLDGLFIIELISKSQGLAPLAEGDPIFNMDWICIFLDRDLLRLENQIPFFVLQTLFENTRVTRRSGGDDQSLAKLFLAYMNNVMRRPDEVLKRIGNVEGKHLLDLFRLSFIPTSPQQKPRNKHVQLIPSVEKLDAAGIKFKATKCDTFLEIRFRNRVLEIPHIGMDDLTTLFFLNSVAFEQCYSNYCSNHMTAYTIFMSLLIKNPIDVGFLYDREIMENFIGTETEMVQFFDDMGKEVVYDYADNYLSKVAEDVNEYRRKGWHVQWAGFKHTYFNTPWAFISALAAFILLLLTIIQAFFAVYPYAGGKRIG
ncbi:hypothetical protein Vadar_034438 [Vaccinium darrowii]|uniref:Uncharacterized protein n=1 Tax=Vaccinium darrowii TaxID=229202 RepID=A0ACB7XEN2_9ERIC|nr:hypothetical protein Vadar_034438 [Vaccinium darrowii]